MNQALTRTLAFVAAAFISTVLAFTSNQLTKPARVAEGEEFDREFNPDFTDASKVSSMRVVSFDEATAASKMFTVQNDGGWKIPSYHNYPADGKDQLSKAAGSVIGLKRGSLVTLRKAEHERYGVIDPLDEENPATKGRGKRITLNEKDTPVADFIIGKEVEGDSDKCYLRKFGEDKVYKVSNRSRFDVSTRFADWAETDLLKVSGMDITRVRGSRPKINDADEYEGDEVVELTKEKSADPWKLTGLDEAAEELKSDDINTMVTTLDDLRLVGVRPRPAFEGRPILNADLKVDLPKELIANPDVRAQVVKMLRTDLGEKGFRVGQDAEGQTQIVSREGELTAGTKDGVVYKLTFGSVFSGSEQEIETGNTEADKGDGKSKKAAKPREDELKKSRYLIVRVNFDESLVGTPPVEPTKPTPPPGVELPADAKEEAADKKEDAPKADTEKKETEKKDSDADSATKCGDDDEKKDEKKEDAKPEEKKPEADKPAEKKEADADKPKAAADEKKADEAKPEDAKKDKDLKAEYFEALKRYDAEKGRFANDKLAFAAKMESGKQKVKELNDRFADWYYVISNDSFDKLRLSRGDLIKLKDKPAEKPADESKEGDDAAKPDAEKKPAEDKGDKKPEASDDK